MTFENLYLPKYFLIDSLNESQSFSLLQKSEFDELLNQNCKVFLEEQKEVQPFHIYRGIDNETLRNSKLSEIDFIKGDTLAYKTPRPSRHTENYYTVFLDYYLKDFEEFPKRSKSLICSTSRDKAKRYGYFYTIIPYDNVKMGICKSDDIWNTFNDELNPLYIDNLAKFNDVISTLFLIFTKNIRLDDMEYWFDTYNFKEIHSLINELNTTLKKLIRRFNHKTSFRDYCYTRDEKFPKYHKVYDLLFYSYFQSREENPFISTFLSQLLNVKKNMKLITYNTQTLKSLPKIYLNNEVWFEGKYLGIMTD